jgi:hypothetical protein
VWSGSSLAITVWGADEFITNGFNNSDPLVYKAWDASAATEFTTVQVAYSGASSYLRTDGLYGGEAIYELTSFLAVGIPAVPPLSTPANNATGVSTSPTLSWGSVPTASGYDLQVSTNSGFTSIVVNQTGISATSHALSGLASGATYYWRVRATNLVGSSSYSAARSFVTQVQTPAAPTLSNPADGASGISTSTTLSWQSVSGAASYDVQVSTASTFSTLFLNATGVTTTSRALSGLANGTTYYWRVRGVNAGGAGSFSAVRSFTTVPAVPAVPTLSVPANGSTGVATSQALSWNSVAGATSYDLQVSPVSNFATTLVNQTGITVTSFSPSGLASNSTYFWRVRAVNSSGNSSYSAPWSFTTSASAPAAPALVSPANGATGIGASTALTWQGVSGATSYEIQVSTQPDFATLFASSSGITSLSYSATGLSSGTTYYWRVRAAGSGGTSSYSSVFSFTVSSRQTIALRQGWNFISSHVDPLNRQMSAALGSALGQIVLVKDMAGQVFSPSLNINTIGDWNAAKGYKLYASAAATLHIDGLSLTPESTPVALSQGWNLASYLRTSPISVDQAVASISEHLVLLKNDAGQVYIPEFGINTIGPLQPGAGYVVYVRQAANLVYPANTGASKALAANVAASAPDMPSVGFSAHIVVQAAHLSDGSVITAWDGARKVGAGTVRNGTALVMVAGDDPYTPDALEGAQAGHAIALKTGESATASGLAFSSISDALAETEVPGIAYQDDALWVVSADSEGEPGLSLELALEQNYPNPFNPSTSIQYTLGTDGHVVLEVYNLLGQHVRTLVSEEQQAGRYEVVFDAGTLTSGVYLYRLQAGDRALVRQMLLVR